MYENRVYPDVPAMLQRLLEAGHRLWVATSKPTVYATRIVEHFGLAGSFEKVYGSHLSGQHADKVELVAHILRTEGLDPSRTVMIGDRMHDIVGGRRNGTRTLGVLWGFGSRQELTDAAPDGLAESTDALVGWVRASESRG
jgi:phosphoglycolate phosphatase